jgi:hypothetical protein
MNILKETKLAGWGEHDFYFANAEHAAYVAKTLRENGFLVADAMIPGRVTIATDVGPGADAAREMIKKMD